MSRFFSRLLLLGALCLFMSLATGCAGSGNKMDQSKVNLIQNGVTTRAQVEQQMGPPSYTAMLPDGGRMLTYSYHETRMSALNFVPIVGDLHKDTSMQQQMLQVKIDANGIVTDHEYTDKTSQYHQGLADMISGNTASVASNTTPASAK